MIEYTIDQIDILYITNWCDIQRNRSFKPRQSSNLITRLFASQLNSNWRFPAPGTRVSYQLSHQPHC